MKVKYRQNYSNECGKCAIANLLSLYNINKEVEIDYSKEGCSAYQIKKYLLKHFKKVEVISFDINQLKYIKNFKPFITLLKKEESSHYVVVYKASKKYLYILDSLTNYSYKITYDNFIKISGNLSIVCEENMNIYLNQSNNKSIAIVSFLSLFETLLTLSTSILLQQIIDNGFNDALLYIIVNFMLLIITRYKIKVFFNLYSKMDEDIVCHTLSKIYNLKYKFISKHNIDEVYFRLQDSMVYKQMILTYIFSFISDVLFMFFSMLLIYFYSVIIGIILSVISILIFIYSYILYKKNQKIVEEKRIEEYEFFNMYRDSFSNVIDIYKNKNKDYENKSLNKLISLQKISKKHDRFNMIKNYNLSMFQSILICIIVLLYFTSLYSYLSIGSLIALINLITLSLQPLLSICSSITEFSNLKLIKDRLNDINNNS